MGCRYQQPSLDHRDGQQACLNIMCLCRPSALLPEPRRPSAPTLPLFVPPVCRSAHPPGGNWTLGDRLGGTGGCPGDLPNRLLNGPLETAH